MSEASWFRRWYWLGIPPVCGVIGFWLGTLMIPDWVVALGIVALTLSVSGVMYWSNKRWISQQRVKMAELAAAPPLDPRVAEQMWRTAQNIGLVSEADATAAIARSKATWVKGPDGVGLNEYTEYRFDKGRQTTIRNEEHGE